jgi:hypothetical protein
MKWSEDFTNKVSIIFSRYIDQEMISKMDERRKWKNLNTEKGRKNYRRLRN